MSIGHSSTKVCTKCHIEKPIEAFYIKVRLTGQRHSVCITCMSHKNDAPEPRPAPTTKVCTKCGIEKPLDEFPFRSLRTRGEQRHSVCKECTAKRTNAWYHANREAHIANVRSNKDAYKEAAREYAMNYLATHPCVDCGETNPNVLEFDHRGGKERTVSEMILSGTYSIERVAAEISKCDVRCANCHRRKTAKERGWFKWLAK